MMSKISFYLTAFTTLMVLSLSLFLYLKKMEAYAYITTFGTFAFVNFILLIIHSCCTEEYTTHNEESRTFEKFNHPGWWEIFAFFCFVSSLLLYILIKDVNNWRDLRFKLRDEFIQPLIESVRSGMLRDIIKLVIDVNNYRLTAYFYLSLFTLLMGILFN